MPLTSSQLESVREMVGDKTYSTIESLCEELNAAQEAAMVYDVTEWERIKFKHVRMVGGDEGVDLDNERNRSALKRRVRQRLQLPVGMTGGLFRIPVGYGSDYCDV